MNQLLEYAKVLVADNSDQEIKKLNDFKREVYISNFKDIFKTVENLPEATNNQIEVEYSLSKELLPQYVVKLTGTNLILFSLWSNVETNNIFPNENLYSLRVLYYTPTGLATMNYYTPTGLATMNFVTTESLRHVIAAVLANGIHDGAIKV